MITGNNELFNSPVRQIKAKVELLEAPTFASPIYYSQNDDLQAITIDRVGESKFFGFGVSQKANIKLIDKAREKNIGAGSAFNIYFNNIDALPTFYVTEVHRDENTNALSITAYDVIYDTSAHYFEELVLSESYTIFDVATACANKLGIGLAIGEIEAEAFDLFYEAGANFEGTETLREVLNDIAEATQTIYFINYKNELVFKKLDVAGEPVATIDKEKYITLDSKTNRRLSAICSATELGDNITASLEVSGTTQFVRDNAFWDLREDIDALVEAALARVGGLTINQFNCSWRGNPLIEIGDKIGLETKSGEIMNSFLLIDNIKFDGSYSQQTEWNYEDTEETASNSSSLGEVIKQTYAKVDKANKKVEIVASEFGAMNDKVSVLQLNTNSINASVSSLETKVNNTVDGMNEALTEMNKKVSATITDEDLEIAVSNRISEGVDKVVTTEKKYTFDDTGLSISSSENKFTTTITENGMLIQHNNEDVLTANNEGVKAIDLHATTFLVIGKNSRLEDYGNYTGCFWLGG